MMFTYMLIPCSSASDINVLRTIAYTGLSVIGLILIFPTFICTIAAISGSSNLTSFVRDMLATFASIFVIVSAILSFFHPISRYFVPIILILCAIITLVISARGLYNAFNKEKNEVFIVKANENVNVSVETNVSPKEDVPHCKHCGAVLKEGAAFCVSCGQKVD